MDMQQRFAFRTTEFPVPVVQALLKGMNEEEFAALGAGSVVFLRPITGAELTRFIPEARMAPEDAVFSLVMSADGAPVLVTDGEEAVSDWLENHEVTLVQRH
jgi:hypothetical protein